MWEQTFDTSEVIMHGLDDVVADQLVDLVLGERKERWMDEREMEEKVSPRTRRNKMTFSN